MGYNNCDEDSLKVFGKIGGVVILLLMLAFILSFGGKLQSLLIRSLLAQRRQLFSSAPVPIALWCTTKMFLDILVKKRSRHATRI